MDELKTEWLEFPEWGRSSARFATEYRAEVAAQIEWVSKDGVTGCHAFVTVPR